MTTQQLTMLTQMITQNHTSNTQNKNDDTTFKDMLDSKKQATSDNNGKTSVKDDNKTSVKEENTQLEQGNDDEDIASKQAALANLLFAQNTMPVQNQMSQQNTSLPAEQIVEPLGEIVDNVQNVENAQIQQVQTITTQAQPEQTNEFVQPEQQTQVKANQNTDEVVQPQAETIQTVNNTQQNAQSNTQENTEDMMQNKTSKTEVKTEVKETETEVVVETPLFQNVESTPVKVGEASPVLDTESPNMEQDLQDIIKYNLKTDGDKVEIQLNPSNLGKITIELVQKDGSMSVLVTAENSKTLSLLAQHASGIETMMQERLSQPVQVFVEQQQPEQQFNDSQKQNQQQNRNHQDNKPSKDEQQSFVDQLRLGLYQIG